MTTIVKVSASQVASFKLCPRRWAWAYIAGLKSPPSAATELGTRVHEILERYLRDGVPPVVTETWRFNDSTPVKYPGKIALQMINAHLPKPGESIAEGKFEFEHNGIHYLGFIDCCYVSESAGGKTVVIIDHKTTADPKKWGKQSADLLTDAQSLVYSVYGTYWHTDAALIVCKWNYGSTKAVASAAYVAHNAMLPAIARKNFEEHVEPFARLITKHKIAGTNPLALPFNADACSVFGGCEHATRCNLSTQERLGAFVMGNSLITDLLAQSAEDNARTDQPKVDPINPPESTSPSVITESFLPETQPVAEKEEPLKKNTLPVAGLPVLGDKKSTKKETKKPVAKATIEQKKPPAPTLTSKAKEAGTQLANSDGSFDSLINEMADLVAERAVKRLVERLRNIMVA